MLRAWARTATSTCVAAREHGGWCCSGPEQLGLANATDVIQPWLGHPLVVPFQNTDATGRPLPLQLTGRDMRRWNGWFYDMERPSSQIGVSATGGRWWEPRWTSCS